MKEKILHGRGFISFLTLASFMMMTLTGIVLYFAPQGRISYWVNWKFWGITKVDWGNIHIVSCFLFVVVGIYHLVYNWKALTNYVSDRVKGGRKLKKELFLTAVISFYIVAGSLYLWPPFDQVIGFSEYAKKAWIVSKDYEPPISHGEQLSLKSFSKRMNIDLAQASRELKEKGIRFEDSGDSLGKIAEANKTSPMEIYRIIKKFEEKPPTVQEARHTPESVEEKFSGTGIGRKTLTEICQQAGIDIQTAKERLARHKIKMKPDQTMRDVATPWKVEPIDILKLILIEDYKLK